MINIYNHLISLTILLAVVIALRLLLFKRLSKKTFVILWIVCLTRLLIPASVSSRFSICNLFSAGETRQPAVSTVSASADISGESAASIWPILILIWLTVALLFTVRLMIRHGRAVREYREALPYESLWLAEWRMCHRLLRPLRVRQSDKAKGAFTYGIFRPVIVLPKSLCCRGREEIECILEHEYVHIAGFDVLFKWAVALAACIYWFHPFVWIMYFLSIKDLEFSCDEAVVRRLGRKERTEYAALLIRLEESRLASSFVGAGFGRNSTRERIEAIMNIKKTTIAGLALSALLVTGVTVAFGTSARASEEKNTVPNANDSKIVDSTGVDRSSKVIKDSDVIEAEKIDKNGSNNNKTVSGEDDANITSNDKSGTENTYVISINGDGHLLKLQDASGKTLKTYNNSKPFEDSLSTDDGIFTISNK